MHAIRSILLAGLLIAPLTVAAIAVARVVGDGNPTPPAPGGTSPVTGDSVRLGVYDPRAVAIAHVRSGGDEALVTRLREQLERAKAGGNEQAVARVSEQGAKLQALRHLQGFSGAPVHDLLQPLVDRLPAIAREAGVVAIVDHVDYADANVTLIDVTDRLVSEFNPDEQTRRVIAELRSKRPAAMLEVIKAGAGD